MADAATVLHREVLELLLEKVENDPYPSGTMMDMIEQMLRPEDVASYAEILLDKLRADRFPSIDMLRRVIALQ